MAAKLKRVVSPPDIVQSGDAAAAEKLLDEPLTT